MGKLIKSEPIEIHGLLTFNVFFCRALCCAFEVCPTLVRTLHFLAMMIGFLFFFILATTVQVCGIYKLSSGLAASLHLQYIHWRTWVIDRFDSSTFFVTERAKVSCLFLKFCAMSNLKQYRCKTWHVTAEKKHVERRFSTTWVFW